MRERRLRTIYIDPSYKAYYQDRLFDDSNPSLNRDDTLAPNIRMRFALKKQGAEIHTADFLLAKKEDVQKAEYYSFGLLENYRKLSHWSNIRMRAFAIFEPPVVAPHLYRELPELTKVFDRVYVHNTEGDGYSLKDVDISRLHKLYWPQARADVIEEFWRKQNRKRRIVVINGNHNPASAYRELYSKRIEAMVSLAKFDSIDLYGRGWKRWWSRDSMWLPYWLNRRTLMSIYKGECASKYETMQHYTFALCFENMSMKGYITEKIFDCFYAGTIPLYWGATDISDLIPREAYIDVGKYVSFEKMYEEVVLMSEIEIQEMREAARSFLKSEQGKKFYDGIINIILT